MMPDDEKSESPPKRKGKKRSRWDITRLPIVSDSTRRDLTGWMREYGLPDQETADNAYNAFCLAVAEWITHTAKAIPLGTRARLHLQGVGYLSVAIGPRRGSAKGLLTAYLHFTIATSRRKDFWQINRQLRAEQGINPPLGNRQHSKTNPPSPQTPLSHITQPHAVTFSVSVPAPAPSSGPASPAGTTGGQPARLEKPSVQGVGEPVTERYEHAFDPSAL